MSKIQNNSDQIINQGICVICAVLGGIITLILNAFVRADLSILAGIGLGLLVGIIACKIRPPHGQDIGNWKKINHFVLTQMDLNSAFSRNRNQPNHGLESTSAPPAAGTLETHP